MLVALIHSFGPSLCLKTSGAPAFSSQTVAQAFQLSSLKDTLLAVTLNAVGLINFCFKYKLTMTLTEISSKTWSSMTLMYPTATA